MMDEAEWYDLKYQLENGDITEDELDENEADAMSYGDWGEYQGEALCEMGDYLRKSARENGE